ncbi:NAD(P)/FAD-dependent oxidoreductase [Gluconacetobacter tumulisoli]|uniref:FAD-binding oxidoreductase n=1 Tax=Gluconacetobacter tumulisoli TaxID=1286189 RepID=A0A7W4K4F2_9PROT|nr:FAD-binding oxidoreductase [Gluconacetobacter tumulisoli]MBB2200058.1 FAD-binding oxidoreductase [Gluconacetobacter tumulisoli]
MLADPRSHGLWECTAPAAPASTALSGQVTTRVAIVGAGYTGLSAALNLASAGIEAVVLDGAEIGFGGSGRNVGLVNAGMWVMPDDLPGTLGQPHGERLLSLLGNAPAEVFDLIDRHAIACEAERAGTLHCADDEKGTRELRERARQWQARGVAVRLLDSAETRTMTGSVAYRAAMLDPRAGTIQPLAYARGLASAAIAAGARIFTRSPVTGCMQSGARYQLDLPGGQVLADQVIVASNAYGTGPWTALAQELMPLPYFNCATPPLPESVRQTILPGRQGAWDTRRILRSFRMDHAGRLVFGSVGALSGAGLSVHREWARRSVARMFPQVGPVRFETEWFGTIGMTADNLPRFHRLAPGIVAICGYNGRGIAPGTVFGRVLADVVRGVTDDASLPLPVADIRPPGFRRARQIFYEAGACLAHAAGERVKTRG